VNVLIAYASRHGATAGIADRIAATMRAEGLAAEVRPVEEIEDISAYEAVVLGGASYLFHWLRDATRFARRHGDELRQRPVWLFSSGPLGTERVDDEGRDVLETARPKEFEELSRVLHPRGERVFFGKYDPNAPPVGVTERVMRHLPAAGEATPAGDFRDWAAVEDWAREITTALTRDTATGP